MRQQCDCDDDCIPRQKERLRCAAEALSLSWLTPRLPAPHRTSLSSAQSLQCLRARSLSPSHCACATFAFFLASPPTPSHATRHLTKNHPGRGKPSQAEPSQAKPGQAEQATGAGPHWRRYGYSADQITVKQGANGVQKNAKTVPCFPRPHEKNNVTTTVFEMPGSTFIFTFTTPYLGSSIPISFPSSVSLSACHAAISPT